MNKFINKSLLFLGCIFCIFSCRLKNKVFHEEMNKNLAKMKAEHIVMTAAHDSIESHYLISIERRMRVLEWAVYAQSHPDSLLNFDIGVDSAGASFSQSKHVRINIKDVDELIKTNSGVNIQYGPLIVKHKELIADLEELIKHQEELIENMEKGNVDFFKVETEQEKIKNKSKDVNKENTYIIETTMGIQ